MDDAPRLLSEACVHRSSAPQAPRGRATLPELGRQPIGKQEAVPLDDLAGHDAERLGEQKTLALIARRRG